MHVGVHHAARAEVNLRLRHLDRLAAIRAAISHAIIACLHHLGLRSRWKRCPALLVRNMIQSWRLLLLLVLLLALLLVLLLLLSFVVLVD